MAAMPDAVQLTRELLNFNTINPPGAEQACAQHLGRCSSAPGFAVDYAEFAPTRTSLVARIGGRPDKRAARIHRPHRHRAARARPHGKRTRSAQASKAASSTAAARAT